MIEVLVALAVAVIVASAAITAVTSALNNAVYSKTQNTATHFAEEGMEYVRKLRNQDWGRYNNAFSSLLPPPDGTNADWDVKCLDKNLILNNLPAGQSYCNQNVDSFIRTVKVEKNSCTCGADKSEGKDIRKVTISVAWSDNKCVVPTSTPTPTPISECSVSSCTKNQDCLSCGASYSCINKSCSKQGGGAQGLDVTPTPTPTPDCNYQTVDSSNSLFCHQIELVSCFSDASNVSAP